MKQYLFAGLWATTCAVSGMTPDGFYYEKNDYIQTRSEALDFTYKKVDPVTSSKVAFKVTDLKMATIAEGQAAASGKDGDLTVFSLLPKEKMAMFATGWYDLAVNPLGAGETEVFHLKFYVRHYPATAKKVVYLLDNVTPEGYAQWLNQPFGDRIEPLRSFPTEGNPDLVVVTYWQSLAAPVMARLREYVNNGGTVLFFGVNDPGFDALSALKVNVASPYNDKVAAIAAPALPQFAAWKDETRYPVNAVAAEGATILAAFSDGRPLLARKSCGKGTVYSLAVSLKPGMIYDSMIADLLQVKPVPAVAAASPRKDGYAAGISENNFGRFGWINSDRMNAIGLKPEYYFQMWDVPASLFRVEFPSVEPNAPVKFYSTGANWLGKTMVGEGGIFGKKTELFFGLGTPGVLYRNADADAMILKGGSMNHLLFPSQNSARHIALESGKSVVPEGMDRNWLLFWDGNRGDREWPLLLTVNRRIKSIEKMGADGIKINFVRQGVDVSVMPLYGVGHLNSSETAQWERSCPPELLKSLDYWSKIQGCRTIGCRESYKVDYAKGTVAVRNDFETLRLSNDWNIAPLEFAPVPPLLPLYAVSGNAVLPASVKDTGYRTFHGPLHAATGSSSVEYQLKLPEVNYPLATKATDPLLDLPANKQLLERICAHLDVPKLIHLPVGGSLVEPVKGRIYPDRDVQPTYSRKGTVNVMERNYIDLHRDLGGTFGAIMLKPYLDGAKGYDPTKKLIEEKIKRNVVRNTEYFQYKTFLLNRNEPITGANYLMSFISPIRLNDGYRIFHDMNETVGIVMQTYYLYGLIYQDMEFLRQNKPFIDFYRSNVLVSNDWTWMSGCAVEWGMGNNIDMLNAELTTWISTYHLEKWQNNPSGQDFAAYMSAKSAASVAARFFFSDYYNSFNFPNLLNFKPVIHEMAGTNQGSSASGKYLPYRISQGYGEGWPSIWPNQVDRGLLKFFSDGKDIYSHSKGIPVELLNLYRNPAMKANILFYENAFQAEAIKQHEPYMYTRIAGGGWLTMDRPAIEAALFRALNNPAISAVNLGAGVADWEVSSMVILLDILRQTADQKNNEKFVPVADEKSFRIQWEPVFVKGLPQARFSQVNRDKEPANVGTGEVAAKFFLPQPQTGIAPAAVFSRYDKKAVADKKCTKLTFMVRADMPGIIDIALPESNWKKNPSASLTLDDSCRQWKKVELSLERDFKLAELQMTAKDLRGEIFIYNGLRGRDNRPDVTFYLDDIRFE